MEITKKLKIKNTIADLTSGVASTILALAILAGGLALAAIFRYGSIGNAIAALRGEVLIVRPETHRFGPVDLGQKVTLEYTLTNVSSAPVRLLGSHSSCSCTVPDRLPMTLRPRETRAVRVRFDAPEQIPASAEGTQFHQDVIIYTSDPSRPQVTLGLVGEVRRPDPSGDAR